MIELHNCKHWATGVKEQLSELGFEDLWSTQRMDSSYLPIIKQRILDQEIQTIMSEYNGSLLQILTV
jgi:hypothetical protein